MAIQRKEPKVGFRTFTPEEAAEILRTSKRRNRRTKPGRVKSYSETMKENKWNPHNSTAISRDWNGDLINGHTRLQACIMAGVPFTTLFIDGVDPATFAEEDSGSPRSPADYLGIALGITEHPKATILGAAARAMEMYDRGLWRMATTSFFSRTCPEARVTNEQLRQCIERRPLLIKGTNYIWSRRALIRNQMRLGMLSCLFALTHGDKAHDAFWGELVDGLEIAPDSPVRQLRDRLDKAAKSSQRINTTYLLALVTKTWNAYQAGETIGKLFWTAVKGTKFPQPTSRLKPTYPVGGKNGVADEEEAEAA